MKMIVGLGNPGSRYERTYHNVGFIAVDKLIDNLGLDIKPKKECNALVYHCVISNQKTLIVKPQTYMNLSGDSVLALKSKYKIDNKDIIVIVDDIDLDKGKLRYRESGSAGTHNGLRSIVQNIGTDFKRLRIGISKDPNMDLADYVLSRIDEDSFVKINEGVEQAIEKLMELING